MLQAVPPPTIMSSNCIYSIGHFAKTLLLPATVVEEIERQTPTNLYQTAPTPTPVFQSKSRSQSADHFHPSEIMMQM